MDSKEEEAAEDSVREKRGICSDALRRTHVHIATPLLRRSHPSPSASPMFVLRCPTRSCMPCIHRIQAVEQLTADPSHCSTIIHAYRNAFKPATF